MRANASAVTSILNNISASSRIGTDSELYLQTVEDNLRSLAMIVKNQAQTIATIQQQLTSLQIKLLQGE